MANSQTVDIATDTSTGAWADSAVGCTVLVGSKEVTFRQGEKFDWHGDRIGIRVALYDGRDTRVMESQAFVGYAKRTARNFDEGMLESVEACPREPSAPLRYSP